MPAAPGTQITRITTNSVWDADADWAPLDVTVRRSPSSRRRWRDRVAPGANVSAVFSEAMRANTLTRTTVTLVRRGTTTPVSATVTYNPDTMRVVLNPASNLSSDTYYTATITTGARGRVRQRPGRQQDLELQGPVTTTLPNPAGLRAPASVFGEARSGM
jgi:hypothetical protein